MNKSSFRLKTITGSILLGLAAPSFAMHLGEPRTMSYVGETLRVEIPVYDTPIEESKDLQAKSVSYPYARKFDGHPEYSITVNYKDEKPFLIVTSPNIVNDSVVDIAVELKWSGARMIQPVSIVLDEHNPNTKTSPDLVTAAISEANNLNTRIEKPIITPPVKVVEPIIEKDKNLVGKEFNYKVKPGDTLYRIAQKTKPVNLSVSAWADVIFSANPSSFLGNKNLLFANSSLILKNEQSAVHLSQVTHKTNSKLHSKHLVVKTDRSSTLLYEAEEKITKLEAQVKLLQEKSKEIDQQIEKLAKSKNSTEKVNAPQKKTGMHLFENNTKGLLATINAYRNLRNA